MFCRANGLEGMVRAKEDANNFVYNVAPKPATAAKNSVEIIWHSGQCAHPLHSMRFAKLWDKAGK